MSRAQSLWLALPSMAVACHHGPDDSRSRHDSSGQDSDTTGDSSSDDSSAHDSDTTEHPPTEPRTVLLITVDTLNRNYVGLAHPTWATMPRTQAFLDGAVVFPKVHAIRAVTGIAFPTIFTGLYPRTSGFRSEQGDPTIPWLQDRFQAAGWHTYGALTNICEMAKESGWDSYLCPIGTEAGSDEGDAQALGWMLDTITKAAPDDKLFLWMHFTSPHVTYNRISPYYEQFHPDAYTGSADFDSNYIDEVSMGNRAWNIDDENELLARYASQVRRVDDYIGSVFDTLGKAGRSDDTVIVYGSDHGEELATRTNYIGHGCSPFNTANQIVWAVDAPQRKGKPGVVDGWVGEVDMAPTILDLAGIPWDGDVEGVSLMPQILDLEPPTRPVFFERSDDLAGVVSDDFKLWVSPTGGYGGCKPFSDAHPYTNELAALYDLDADPDEQHNLYDVEPDLRDTMLGQVCGWVLEKTWSRDDDVNSVVQLCRSLP